MRKICLLWIVTACYSAHVTDKLACSETMQCPNGQTCDLDSLTCYEVPPVAAKFTQLAAGANHTCGIDQIGALYCWGQNDNGQLGVGDSDGRATPTRVGDQTDWSVIAAGGSSTCGLRGTTLWCWGDRLDVGVTSNVPLQIVTPMTTWAAVSVTRDHTCAVETNGQVWCHTFDEDAVLSQLGISPITNPGQLVAGTFRQCAIDGDHHLFCWGNNSPGSIGDGTQVDAATPYLHTGSWLQVAMGTGGTTCAIAADSHLWCWGDCDQNQATSTDAPGSGYCLQPSQIGLDTYLQVAVGGAFTCAIRSDGTMVCFGRNVEGQLGTTSIRARSTPVEIAKYSDWTAITAGDRHACGLRASGEAWCWGYDRYGQLGNGNTTVVATPSMVDARMWLSVSTGLSTTCGIDAAHDLYCWGENGAGQLGDGTTTRHPSPTKVGSTSDWTKVSAGRDHTCGLRNNNTLWCWGDNRYGELGLGNTNDVTEHAPRQVGIEIDWTDISAGNDDSLGLRSTAGLFYWGDYQVMATPKALDPGTGWSSLSGSTSSEYISGGEAALSSADGNVYFGGNGYWAVDPNMLTAPNFTVMSRGADHTCAISATAVGAMKCWGQDYGGQLGGTTEPPNEHTAVQVQGGFGWQAVDAGAQATCGITDSTSSPANELYCWGQAALIPRAISTDTTHLPTRISPGVSWTAVSISDHHGCAIRADQSLWCWGDNDAGEVGVGPTSQAQPVRVLAGVP